MRREHPRHRIGVLREPDRLRVEHRLDRQVKAAVARKETPGGESRRWWLSVIVVVAHWRFGSGKSVAAPAEAAAKERQPPLGMVASQVRTSRPSRLGTAARAGRRPRQPSGSRQPPTTTRTVIPRGKATRRVTGRPTASVTLPPVGLCEESSTRFFHRLRTVRRAGRRTIPGPADGRLRRGRAPLSPGAAWPRPAASNAC